MLSTLLNIQALEKILDEMLEGFQVISKDWVYLYVNESVAKQGKRKKEELLGKTMMECYPGIEKTPLFEEFKRCMDKNIKINIENLFKFPDGSEGWFQLLISPVNEGFMIFSFDITDRKRTESQLIDKVEELNRVTELMVSREVKMSELKELIQELGRLIPSQVTN